MSWRWKCRISHFIQSKVMVYLGLVRVYARSVLEVICWYYEGGVDSLSYQAHTVR